MPKGVVLSQKTEPGDLSRVGPRKRERSGDRGLAMETWERQEEWVQPQ